MLSPCHLSKLHIPVSRTDVFISHHVIDGQVREFPATGIVPCNPVLPASWRCWHCIAVEWASTMRPPARLKSPSIKCPRPGRASELEDFGCSLAWRAMGSAKRHCPRVTAWNVSQKEHYTGSVVAWVTKDCASGCTPGSCRWKVDYWCAKKIIRARINITIGTWNVRTLKDVGKLEELQHEMKRYDWNILGLCESRLLKAGEKSTQEGHRLFWSGQDNIYEQGVGLLVHKNTVNCVTDCCPISNRLITIRLRAKPFNITIIQVYAPTSAYSNEDI